MFVPRESSVEFPLIHSFFSMINWVPFSKRKTLAQDLNYEYTVKQEMCTVHRKGHYTSERISCKGTLYK